MFRALLSAVAFFSLSSMAFANWQSITQTQFLELDNGILGAARYRQGGTGNELYVGVPDLGVGSNRVEGNSNWTSGVAKTFTFNYTGTASQGSLGASGVKTFAGAPDGFTDSLLMVIRLNANQSVNLTGMTLGATAINDLSVNSTQNNSAFYYLLSGYSNNSILSGNMTLNFASGNVANERPAIEIGAAAVVPEPSTYAILVSSVGAVLYLRRRKRS